VSVEPDSVNADLTRVAGSRPFWLDRRYFDLHLTGASPFERALQVVRHSSCSLENWHAPFRCFATSFMTASGADTTIRSVGANPGDRRWSPGRLRLGSFR
jgi:hypothetical protein